jgi:molecular chaperone Hsp33
MPDLDTTSDHALTAITHDGAFRVLVARTTDTVRASVSAQKIAGAEAEALAEVLTGTILVRLTMAPTYRVQGIVQAAGRKGTLVGDSRPDGTARGLVQKPEGVEAVRLGSGALMQMLRTMPTGDVHQGIVEVPAGSVSGALMSYFQASEQIEGVAFVGALRRGEDVAAAGGFMVQLLPEVSRDPLAVMTDRLSAGFFEDPSRVVATLEEDPGALLDTILEDMPYERTQEAELRFGCHCRQVRLLASLGTLPKDDIEELVASEEELHITCDYCGTVYQLDPKALVGLLESS